ncbi:MAG TPA: hypothetical protein PKL57_19215, partial [Candidatus Wallbacteria bacterium]|nr:hypothetical protein [Candidatus Wallbacteria bacterium]
MVLIKSVILTIFLIIAHSFAALVSAEQLTGAEASEKFEYIHEITIFAAIVQAARDTANPEQASKLQTYQLGDPSPDFDKMYPVRLMLKKKSD